MQIGEEGSRPPADIAIAERLVSIVVNNYNYARFLGHAIDSALAQTYPHTEVVVVDDGSTDGSQELIATYGDRIRPVLKENGGQASAFNAGFAVSRGDIVVFLDADDLLLPDTVERVVSAWRPGTAKVQYRLRFVDGAGAQQDGAHPHPADAMPTGDVTREILRWGEYISSPTSGNAFAREALNAILPMPADAWRLSADAYLVYLAPFHGAVISIEEPLGYYRVHGQNNWTHDGPDLSRLAFMVRTDLQKQEAVLAAAKRRNLRTAPDLVMNSPWHVNARIMLSLLDPGHAEEPYPLRRLAWKGMQATWRHPRSSLRLKAATTVWLSVLPLVPRRAATRLALWRMYPSQRPALLRRLKQLIQ